MTQALKNATDTNSYPRLWKNEPMTFRIIVALMLSFGLVGHSLANPAIDPRSDDDVQFERLLLTNLQPLLDQLRRRDVNVVGILKFAVKHAGDERFASNLGLLNERITAKIENAVVLSNPADERSFSRKLAVARNASAVAARIPGITFPPNQQSRENLFSQTYPLVWKHQGKTEAKPDAFICGIGEISEDMRTIEIELWSFIKGQTEDIFRPAFKAPLDLSDLSHMGQDFVNPAAESGTTSTDEAFASAGKIRELPAEQHPLQRTDLPVKLEILYDDQPQPLHFLSRRSDGVSRSGAYICEPRAGQKVKFVLSRTQADDPKRYGVLLRVNGENTIQRQRLSDRQSRIWILNPNNLTFALTGYQMVLGEAGESHPFEIVEGKTADDLANYFGEQAGLISLTVFAEATYETTSHRDENRIAKLLMVKHSAMPDETADNPSQLAGRLAKTLFGQSRTRGIVRPSQKSETFVTKTEKFTRAPQPLFSASVRYFQPNGS